MSTRPRSRSADDAEKWASPHRGLRSPLVILAVYFGLVLIREWWPAFGGTGAFFFYMLSIPVVLLILVALAVWGIVGAARSRWQGSPLSKRHRAQLLLPLAGFVMFASAMTLARTIRGALPTGSRLLKFDSAVWRDPKSTEFVEGDITPRQKMLGSLVDRLDVSKDRAELEALLGPSLVTPYFESTGRDLIYVLGPERVTDTFFAIDSEWLLIWLDDSGRFARYDIYSD